VVKSDDHMVVAVDKRAARNSAQLALMEKNSRNAACAVGLKRPALHDRRRPQACAQT